MPRDAITYNPLVKLIGKTRVGQEDTDVIALPVLCWFDAAKRGQCTATGCNHLTLHLVIASYIASKTRSARYHAIVTKAYAMLGKAAARPTPLLDLTTPEYAALREAFAWYIRSLPNVEVGMLNDACKVAAAMMEAA